MAFTLIPRGANSAAHTRTNCRSAAFDAEYTPNPGVPRCADVEPVTTMVAPDLSSGSDFCTVKTVPLTLIPKVCS